MLPGVSEVVTDKRELPDLLGRFGVVDIPSGISQFGNRHRAYLKVQDGCLLRCSYCIIPHVRPHVISRGVPEILDEVRRLLDNGYREFVLTGVHLGHYGVEQNRGKAKATWLRLSHLVRELVAVEGDFRLRLSSIEATEVTRELVDTVAEYPDKICPHFHICLQSGADRILRRMGRRWAARMFVDRCRFVQDRLDVARVDDRRHRRISRRDRRRFSGDLPAGARDWLLEDSHLPVQHAPRHAGRRHARPGFQERKDRSQPTPGGNRTSVAARLFPATRWTTVTRVDRNRGRRRRGIVAPAPPAAMRRWNCRRRMPSSGQLVSCVPYAADDQRLQA